MTVLAGRKDRSVAASPAPRAVKVDEAARLIAGSVSEVFSLLRKGELLAVKRGSSTLVLTASIDAHMEGLPPARYGADRAA